MILSSKIAALLSTYHIKIDFTNSVKENITWNISSVSVGAEAAGGSDGVNALELLLAMRSVSMRTALPPEGSSRSSVAEKERAGSRDRVLGSDRCLYVFLIFLQPTCIGVT